MFLPDPDVITLPTALVVKENQRYFKTIRACYPGWNGIHLTPLGFVVMTTKSGRPINGGGSLYFWIPMRDREKVEPGIDFWRRFWDELSAEAVMHESAFNEKKESHEMASWVATLARVVQDTDSPEHHAFADLGLVNEGIQICIKHCSIFDLRTLAAFLIRYADTMEKGNQTP